MYERCLRPVPAAYVKRRDLSQPADGYYCVPYGVRVHNTRLLENKQSLIIAWPYTNIAYGTRGHVDDLSAERVGFLARPLRLISNETYFFSPEFVSPLSTALSPPPSPSDPCFLPDSDSWPVEIHRVPGNPATELGEKSTRGKRD